MVPVLPRVTIFSATERAALALASVVVIRLCLIKLQTRLASIALRWEPVRPSLAVRLRCLMGQMLLDAGLLFLGQVEKRRIDIHTKAQAQAGELLLDFVQRYFAEIALLEHF